MCKTNFDFKFVALVTRFRLWYFLYWFFFFLSLSFGYFKLLHSFILQALKLRLNYIVILIAITFVDYIIKIFLFCILRNNFINLHFYFLLFDLSNFSQNTLGTLYLLIQLSSVVQTIVTLKINLSVVLPGLFVESLSSKVNVINISVFQDIIHFLKDNKDFAIINTSGISVFFFIYIFMF